MTSTSNSIAFFDIGNTLASVRLAADEPRIQEMIVFPRIPQILAELRQNEVRLGILSDRGPIPAAEVLKALKRADLHRYFEPDLILFGPKDSSLLFEQAAARATQVVARTPGRRPTLMFVGEDASERAYARAVDFLVAPHPKLALSVLRGQGRLRYLRINIPPSAAAADWRAQLRSLPVVPLHLSVVPGLDPPLLNLLAISDALSAAKLDDLGFWVDRLGVEDEPATSDLYILRDDRQVESGFLVPEGNAAELSGDERAARCLLTSTHEGLVMSIPAGRSVESYHFSSARHGHNLRLVASESLLEPANLEDNPRLAETVGAAEQLLTSEISAEGLLANLSVMLKPAEKTVLQQQITAQKVRRDVERYTGVLPVMDTTKIFSRHIHHPSNAVAVRALIRDFKQAGAGRLTIRTHRFTHEGRPYDNVEAILPGSTLPGIVLVTAHMDSTAARRAGYRASEDAAPGADDDASGIAGVLSAARALLTVATPPIPRREIRFVLFNAEEHGLIGSRAYAAEQARIAAKIVAVFQLDMVGFDVRPGRTFELHAGFTSNTGVQTRSIKLAKLVSTMVPEVSAGLPPPQLYPSNGSGDPAENRSDHSSFQLEGFAACLASEDFFAGPGASAPVPDPNPNYHLPTDNAVNAGYTADIVRAVTAAAWVAATR